MPATVATRDDKIYADGQKLYESSKRLSRVLRHASRSIRPFNAGGWYRCSELYELWQEWTT
eukprot:11674374-Heterocapsa_arctica.AAC.1